MAESSSTKRTPRITVIVPSFRDRDQLEKTLTALRAQTLSAAEFDVVVVNNDPETPLDVDASGLNLTTATESEPGSYAARAAGLAVATTELLAFTDAGCLPRTDWLEEGLAGLDSDPRPDVVAGDVEIVWDGEGSPPLAAQYEMVRAFPVGQYVERFGFGVTANLFSRRAVFDRVGVFDRSLLSGGDAEWCQRVGAAGGTVVFNPAVIVDHPARTSFRALVRKVRRVNGGLHDRMKQEGQTRAFLRRGLVHALLPPIRQVLVIVRARRAPTTTVALVGFEVALNYVAVLERLKLLIGIGEAARA